MWIFGTPVSWLLVEVLSVVVFLACIVHATKQENPSLKILELFGFILGAAIFENIGVNNAHAYYYDVRRWMMIGDVPLQILVLEAAIWYSAFIFAQRLRVPLLAIPFVVGLFGSLQDMTIDPAAVYDRYPVSDEVAAEVNSTHPGALGNGILSGQWNWSDPGYTEAFFGIPVYNWSGWMYLMAFYTAWVVVGRALYRKTGYSWVGFSYPFIAGVLNVVCLATPVNRLLLFGTFNPSETTMLLQILMVTVNYSVAIILLAVSRKNWSPINLPTDGGIVFGLPLLLHLFDIIYVFSAQTEGAYAPVLLVSIIHGAFLISIFVWSRSKKDIYS